MGEANASTTGFSSQVVVAQNILMDELESHQRWMKEYNTDANEGIQSPLIYFHW